MTLPADEKLTAAIENFRRQARNARADAPDAPDAVQWADQIELICAAAERAQAAEAELAKHKEYAHSRSARWKQLRKSVRDAAKDRKRAVASRSEIKTERDALRAQLDAEQAEHAETQHEYDQLTENALRIEAERNALRTLVSKLGADLRLKTDQLAAARYPETVAAGGGVEFQTKMAAAKRRAKEHRRQLRQMNKAIARYASTFREGVHREAAARANRDAEARVWDRERFELMRKLEEAERRAEENQEEVARYLNEERDALRARVAELEGTLAGARDAVKIAELGRRDESYAHRQRIAGLQRDRERLCNALQPFASISLERVEITPHGDVVRTEVLESDVRAARAAIAARAAEGSES